MVHLGGDVDFALEEESLVVALITLTALDDLSVVYSQERKSAAVADAVGEFIAELLVVVENRQEPWTAPETNGFAVEESV